MEGWLFVIDLSHLVTQKLEAEAKAETLIAWVLLGCG